MKMRYHERQVMEQQTRDHFQAIFKDLPIPKPTSKQKALAARRIQSSVATLERERTQESF